MTTVGKTGGTRAELIEEIQTRGAWEAYRVSLEIARDPNAPKNARTQAASNVLRAGGYFGARSDEGGQKELHEMTYAELIAAAMALRGELKNAEEIPKLTGGVFD